MVNKKDILIIISVALFCILTVVRPYLLDLMVDEPEQETKEVAMFGKPTIQIQRAEEWLEYDIVESLPFLWRHNENSRN